MSVLDRFYQKKTFALPRGNCALLFIRFFFLNVVYFQATGEQPIHLKTTWKNTFYVKLNKLKKAGKFKSVKFVVSKLSAETLLVKLHYKEFEPKRTVERQLSDSYGRTQKAYIRKPVSNKRG